MPNNQDVSDLQNASSGTEPTLNELISLSEAADRTGISASHLRLLVRQGDVWGKKIGRNWLTTEQVVRDYQAQNRRPGPKPQ